MRQRKVARSTAALIGVLAALLLPVHGAVLEPLSLAPGVKPPKIKKRTEPKLTTHARAYRIQGTVVLEGLISEEGRATNLNVISRLGYGLDDKAVETVSQWKFFPATQDGVPVPARVTIEVNFRRPLDPRRPTMQLTYFAHERQRTLFNVALAAIRRPDAENTEKAVKTMQELAKDGFPGALYLVGMWERGGEYMPRDREAGMEKIRKAAKKLYGPALYEVALQSMRPRSGSEPDWDTMRQAAMLGSVLAQFFLGDHHEQGRGVEQSRERASNYFRLCASRGVPDCQYRLGRLMWSAPDLSSNEHDQALAWLSLAAEKGSPAARRMVEPAVKQLSEEQERNIATLKKQLVGNFDALEK